MLIVCPRCKSKEAECHLVGTESDGAEWTWSIWEHSCRHCGYKETGETRDTYNFEDLESCGIGHEESKFSNSEIAVLVASNYRLNAIVNELISYKQALIKKGSIFVSYSHKDSDFVLKLTNSLAQDGFDYWHDIKDLPAGQDLDKALSEAIQASLIYLIVLTPNSLRSNWVNREFEEASYENIESGKAIIPVVKDLEHNQLNKRIQRKTYINCTNADAYSEQYAYLKKSILYYLHKNK
jgi:hypothetical protein